MLKGPLPLAAMVHDGQIADGQRNAFCRLVVTVEFIRSPVKLGSSLTVQTEKLAALYSEVSSRNGRRRACALKSLSTLTLPFCALVGSAAEGKLLLALS